MSGGCVYDVAWVGPCGAPVTVNGLCEGHATVRCSCGRQAYAECDIAGSLVCGRPVCAQLGRTCVHHGGRHDRAEDDRVDFKVEEVEKVVAANLPLTRHVVRSTTPGRSVLGQEQARPAPEARVCRTCGERARFDPAGVWVHEAVADAHPPDVGLSAQDAVIADLERRKEVGLERYGTLLYPHNGRDMLRDLYEELLDACVYLRAAIDERDAR